MNEGKEALGLAIGIRNDRHLVIRALNDAIAAAQNAAAKADATQEEVDAL